MRQLLAAIMAGSVLMLSATPAAAEPTFHAEEMRVAGAATTASSSSLNPCSDGAYKLMGAKWTSPLAWYFRASSTPAGLNRGAVEGVLKNAFANITGARNDCGLGDNVSASAAYQGQTTRRPACATYDGYNVVGFKSLSGNRLAVTCYWTMGGRIVEADIQINSNQPWALSLVGCLRRSLLEATMTHEVGHAFGLDHVGELTHGRLTMSPVLDGLCNNNESTLGLGDVRGLEALY
jgi:hypothetical protein